MTSQDVRLVWWLSKLFGGLNEVFEDRPRGSLGARLAGKLPGVGVVGGFFDERKGIKKAAYEAAELLTHECVPGQTGLSAGPRRRSTAMICA